MTKIVFWDIKNQELDKEYAEKLRQEIRDQLDWKVEEWTRIYNELTEFSKMYSKKKRDIVEVATIFRMANWLM